VDRWRTNRDFAYEWLLSLKIKRREPLGEVALSDAARKAGDPVDATAPPDRLEHQ